MNITKKVFSRVICVFMTVVMVLLGLTSQSMKASASWHGWTTATFKSYLEGITRYYDGNNVGLNWGASTSNSKPSVNKNAGFTIKLQRKNGIFWTTIGSKKVNRTGSGSAVWTNVGSGNYRFVFQKANDGTTEYVKDIEMYSW